MKTSQKQDENEDQEINCEIRKQIIRLFGKEADCYPDGVCIVENPCQWASPCPECGMPRIRAYDPDWGGWHNLCLNKECGCDK